MGPVSDLCCVFALPPDGVEVVGAMGTAELPSLRSDDVRNQPMVFAIN